MAEPPVTVYSVAYEGWPGEPGSWLLDEGEARAKLWNIRKRFGGQRWSLLKAEITSWKELSDA